jgi:hypothetical protein
LVFVICLFYMPDTSGKSLEEIEAMYRNPPKKNNNNNNIRESCL